MSIVIIKKEEKQNLKDAVRFKYHSLNKDNANYSPIIRTTTKLAYTRLTEEIIHCIKSLNIPSDVAGYPREAFFVKLFDNSSEMNSRTPNINSCYLYAYGQTRDAYLSSNSTIDKSDHFMDSIVVRLAKHEDVRKIANLAATVYSGIDIIPYHTMLEWYEKNPCSMYVIENQDGNLVGNIDILPLKDDVLQKFMDGTLIEREIRGTDIWGLEEKEQIENLYIESVVSLGGRTAIIELLKIMPTIIMNFGCSYNSIKKVYCISASKQGTQLISKLGFKEIIQKNDRRDKHEIYSADVVDVFHALYNIFSRNNNGDSFDDGLSRLTNGTGSLF